MVTKETARLVRVLLPDTSTTMISARPGLTIRNAVNKLFERRNVKVVAFDVYDDATDKVCLSMFRYNIHFNTLIHYGQSNHRLITN